MTAQVIVTLSDNVYEQVRNYAWGEQQDIAQIIADFLENTFPAYAAQKPIEPQRTEQLQALDREKEAFIRLHPQLKQSHWGRYVAIYQGQLIDEDGDFGILVERVRSQLPTEVVWVSEVEEEAIPTIMMRSPRFMRERAL